MPRYITRQSERLDALISNSFKNAASNSGNDTNSAIEGMTVEAVLSPPSALYAVSE